MRAVPGRQQAGLADHLYSRCSPGQSARAGGRGVWAGEECTRSRRSNQPRPGESTSELGRTIYSRCSSLGKAHVSTCAGWEGEKVRSRTSMATTPSRETQASFEGASKRAHVWTEPGC